MLEVAVAELLLTMVINAAIVAEIVTCAFGVQISEGVVGAVWPEQVVH